MPVVAVLQSLPLGLNLARGQLLIIVWVFPNTLEWMHRENTALGLRIFNITRPRMAWKPNTFWAVTLSMAFVLSVLALNEVSEFLYFQF